MAMHDESGLVRPSRRLLSFFSKYLHWYIGRHFHAMRLANASRFPRAGGPLIVYANHASWWDPLAFIMISRYFLPTAFHYGPMDAAALKHYAFLRKLGLVSGGSRNPARSGSNSCAPGARSSPLRTPFSGSPLRGASPTCAPVRPSFVPEWQRWLHGSAHAPWYR